MTFLCVQLAVLEKVAMPGGEGWVGSYSGFAGWSEGVVVGLSFLNSSFVVDI